MELINGIQIGNKKAFGASEIEKFKVCAECNEARRSEKETRRGVCRGG